MIAVIYWDGFRIVKAGLGFALLILFGGFVLADKLNDWWKGRKPPPPAY